MKQKQIIIHADPDTHAWLKSEAAISRRTLGNHILALLIGCKATPAKPKRGASK